MDWEMIILILLCLSQISSVVVIQAMRDDIERHEEVIVDLARIVEEVLDE